MERCDRNAGCNYIPSANVWVQVDGHFVTDGVCVCVCVCVAVAQSSSLPKSHVEWAGSLQSLDWTGLVDWTGGLDWWTGWWTGLVDWTGGLG